MLPAPTRKIRRVTRLWPVVTAIPPFICVYHNGTTVKAIMRMAALGLNHETNTLSSFPTTYESFKSSSYGGVLRGPEIEQHQRSAHSTFAGYFQAADEFGFDLVPLLFAVNDPSGTITSHAFDSVVDEMMRLLAEHGPWDGVLHKSASRRRRACGRRLRHPRADDQR